MGLTPSAWGVLAVPAAGLIGFGFAGAGLGLTTFMRSWFDFDYVQLVIIPLFLFSATFFPLSQYPDALAWVVRLSPLYQGVALERALVLGDPSPELLFVLRGVDPETLVAAAGDAASSIAGAAAHEERPGLRRQDLAEIFGIELERGAPAALPPAPAPRRKASTSCAPKPTGRSTSIASSIPRRSIRCTSPGRCTI